MNILNIYKTKDTFTNEDLKLIGGAIDSKEILTEDIVNDFKKWAYSQALPIDDEDIISYCDDYDNGFTHMENLNNLINN